MYYTRDLKFSKHGVLTFYREDVTCSSEILTHKMPDYPIEMCVRLGGPHANSLTVITIESKKIINK